MSRPSCSTRAPLWATLFVAVALVAVSLAAGVVAAGEEFDITSVSWKAEKSMLRVEGVAEKPDSLVVVRDADTNAMLGCAAVRADGKWMLKLWHPKTVPTRVRGECDGAVKECGIDEAQVASK